jgi:hypothetical protein
MDLGAVCYELHVCMLTQVCCSMAPGKERAAHLYEWRLSYSGIRGFILSWVSLPSWASEGVRLWPTTANLIRGRQCAVAFMYEGAWRSLATIAFLFQ